MKAIDGSSLINVYLNSMHTQKFESEPVKFHIELGWIGWIQTQIQLAISEIIIVSFQWKVWK